MKPTEQYFMPKTSTPPPAKPTVVCPHCGQKFTADMLTAHTSICRDAH